MDWIHGTVSKSTFPALGAVALALFAGTGPAAAQPAAAASILTQPQVDVGKAIVLPDVVYSRPQGFRPLKLDIYKPKGATGPRPVVVWFHGGGWAAGDARGGPFGGTDGPAFFAELAGRGYVVASASYRFVREAKFPAQVEDARAAVRYLRANAAHYGIDPTQVFAAGGSAGGYLSTMLGLACGDASFDPPARPGANGAVPPPPPAGSECVQGVVDAYPVTELLSLAQFKNPNGPPYASAEGILGTFLGCAPAACPPASQQRFGVMQRISATSPPFLILHGDTDVTVPVDESRKFDAALKAKGVSSQLIVVPGYAHTFPQAPPELRANLTQQIGTWLDAHSRR